MAPEPPVPGPDGVAASEPDAVSLETLEIATIGFVATIAARVLGLSGLDLLLAVFFSTTLAGQFLTAFLNKMRPT